MAQDLPQLAAMLRPLHLTKAEFDTLAKMASAEVPLLRDAIAALPPDQVTEIRERYPQGYEAFMNGVPSGHGLPAVIGFGQRRLDEVNTPNVQAELKRYQRIVAARGAAKDKRPTAGHGSRDGWAAARQGYWVAKDLVSLLVEHRKVSGNPLAKLKLPKAPGPARDRALSIAERRDWCRIIMLHDPDPVLAALVWMLWIIYGARNCEVERLREADFNVARSSLVLVGKDGPRRERPMHRPLARLLHDILAARPHAPKGELLRGPTGHPVTGRTWDRWSELLHQWAPWAEGFRIGPYSLRHTTARQSIKVGFDTAATGRYIGHAVPGGLGVPANYGFDWTDAGTWDDCVVMAEAIFGSLDAFPVLSENDILGPILGLDLPTPRPAESTSA